MRGLLIAAILCTAASAAAPVPAFATVRAGIEAWRERRSGAGDRHLARAGRQGGHADAAFNLGQAYRLGRGVPADSSAARNWFERAAKAGHIDAQVSLGLLLFDVGDRATALTWLGRAAEKGDPRAMLVTGTALFNGDGMKRDPVLGYAYVSRAAAQGLAPAKATLADMDKVLPLADRQKGVALALKLAGTAPVAEPAPKIPAPKVAKAAPPPKPKVAADVAKPPVAVSGNRRMANPARCIRQSRRCAGAVCEAGAQTWRRAGLLCPGRGHDPPPGRPVQQGRRRRGLRPVEAPALFRGRR